MFFDRIGAGAVLALTLLFANGAGAQSCTVPPIEQCPSFYKERCTADDDFKGENAFACLDVLTGAAKDDEICATLDPSCSPVSCDDPNMEPQEVFFCKKGFPSCPASVPGLKAGFDSVLGELVLQLDPYREILAISKDGIPNMELLCNYSRQDFQSYEALATEDRDGLDQINGQLGVLTQCSELMDEFLNSPPPTGVGAQLWEEIKGVLRGQMKDVKSQQGQVLREIQELNEAPAEIRGLKTAHSIGCL